MQGAWRCIGETFQLLLFRALAAANNFPGDAHDAGRSAMDLKKALTTDAHDAGLLPVDWKKALQLMLMMLGSCRWTEKALQLMLMMLGSCLWIGKEALQLMLMMLGSCLWIGKEPCN